MTEFLTRVCEDWLAAGEPVALVSVAVAKGSTPRESGARMLVTERASAGTIGGGRLEYEAIGRARALLAAGEVRAELLMPLGPEIGQCCGGHVTLRLRRMDPPGLAELATAEAAEARKLPSVLLFGAGHVGQALASSLAPLPVQAVLDRRAGRGVSGTDARRRAGGCDRSPSRRGRGRTEWGFVSRPDTQPRARLHALRGGAAPGRLRAISA